MSRIAATALAVATATRVSAGAAAAEPTAPARAVAGPATVHGSRIAFRERVTRGERLTALNDPCRWRREILVAQPLASSAH